MRTRVLGFDPVGRLREAWELRPGPPSRPLAVIGTGVLLLVMSSVPTSALAAEAEAEPDGAQAPPSAIETVNGKRFKMAKARMAQQLTRIHDAAADQLGPDGTEATAAEPWTDMASVYIARVKVPPKLLTKMRQDHPPGSAGAFYGADADWSKKEPAAFVAVEVGEPRPDETTSQQVEIGFDGSEVVPVQAATTGEPRVGIQRFSLSGRFANGTYGSGTTDLTDWQLGAPIEFYDARSEVMGYYDAREGIFYLIAPIPRGAGSVTVTLRTETPAGEVIDRLELPTGGHFVDLDEPGRGIEALQSAGLACRSVATRPSPASGEQLVSITLGAADAEAYRQQLAELLTGVDELEVPVREVGAAAEPRSVPAEVRLAPAVNAAIVTLAVPEGRWLIGRSSGEAPDGREPDEQEPDEPDAPDLGSLVDLGSLTGAGGLLTGAALEGIAAGDPECGRWSLPAGACSYAPEAPLATLVGLEAGGVSRSTLLRPDGTEWCVGVDAATGGPKYVVGIGTAYTTAAAFARDVEAHRCPATPVEIGAESVILDCGEENFESYYVRVLPAATAASDPDGGLLVSVDLVVDPGRPFGERYDGALAEETFAALGREVAAGAVPAMGIRDPDASTDEAAGDPGAADDGSDPEAPAPDGAEPENGEGDDDEPEGGGRQGREERRRGDG